MTPAERVDALLASGKIARTSAPRDGATWPLAGPLPGDLAALYALCDGLSTDDGATVLGLGELADATRWLVVDRALDWDDDLLVVGERHDAVVVLDLDTRGARAGGGVLEAATDDLVTLTRVASDVVAWLSLHAGGVDPSPPPERAAEWAATHRDEAALDAALSRDWYPRSEGAHARALVAQGGLRAARGDAGAALSSFEASVALRLSTVRRGAEGAELRAAWRACAIAARKAGDAALAAVCESRMPK